LIKILRAEVVIALRQRLNETVEALDVVRKEHNELTVCFEAQSKELTVAKSDREQIILCSSSTTPKILVAVSLVDKDQLEIISTLRASVSEDKIGLEATIERLQNNFKELSEKNKMQLEQINSLLMEKVNLQTESIGQRDKMLERERDFK
jgi:protein HOOK3